MIIVLEMSSVLIWFGLVYVQQWMRKGISVDELIDGVSYAGLGCM